MRKLILAVSISSFLFIGGCKNDTGALQLPAKTAEPNPAPKPEPSPAPKPETKPAPKKDPCVDLCMDRGECTYKDGKCIVGGDDDCRTKSRACRMYGRCTAKDGKCTVASDADCKPSQKCRDFKECTAKDGECVK